MKIETSVFYWLPGSDDFRVFEHLVDSIPRGMTTGAVFADWKGFSTDERVKVALADALSAICRDGVDPAAVAKALMSVDELREALPTDFPGSPLTALASKGRFGQ